MTKTRYSIQVNGEEIDHADTQAEAQRHRDTIIYGGIGTAATTKIIPQKPFATVTELANGRFAVESGGKGRMAVRWGDCPTRQEAQGIANRLNEASRS